MKKIHLFIILLLIISSTYAQNSQKKGGFYFGLSTGYRLTPFSGKLYSNSINTSPDQQSTGLDLSYNIDYYILNSWSLGFSNSFRYDLVSYDANTITTQTGTQGVNNAILIGWHFYTDYHFKLKNKRTIFFRVGKSVLNENSNYVKKVPLLLGSSEYHLQNYTYGALNVAVGYQKNKSKLILGFYTSKSSNYLSEKGSFTVPYFKFNYILGKL